MKKVLLTIVAIMLIASTHNLFAQSKIKVDVKTHLKDLNSLALQKGLSLFLKQNDYKVVNLNEDYEVWINDLKREIIGTNVTVKFNIQIKGERTNNTYPLQIVYSTSNLNQEISNVDSEILDKEITSNSVLNILRKQGHEEEYIIALKGGQSAFVTVNSALSNK